MSEVINQLQNIGSISFEDATNIFGITAISAGVGLGLGTFAADYIRSPKSEDQGQRGTDVDLLQEVVAQEKHGKFNSRLKRWAPVLLMSAGVSIASVQLLDPTISSETERTGVQTMHIIDASSSMEYTADMSGESTRKNAVIDAITDATKSFPKDLSNGAILFGENVQVASPLTKNITLLQNGIRQTEVDANGGNLFDAINLGSTVLEGSSNVGRNTMFIYTDGTTTQKPEAAKKIEQLAQQGTNVVIVMPGTPDGSFLRTQFDTKPTLSGVDQTGLAKLDELDNVTVVTATSKNDIKTSIEQNVHKATSKVEKHPTNLFLYAGAVLGSLGFLSVIRRTFKRA